MIDVFRMGWYAGAGARRGAGPVVREGIAQDVPPPEAITGLVECAWHDPYRLDTRDQRGPWPVGSLARLTTMRAALPRPKGSGLQAGESRVETQSVCLQKQQRARAQSVVRSAVGDDVVRLDGADDFMRRREYNAVRLLEREGYASATPTKRPQGISIRLRSTAGRRTIP